MHANKTSDYIYITKDVQDSGHSFVSKYLKEM